MPTGGIFNFQGLQLQTSTPGVSQSGNFHISGTGIADVTLDGRGSRPVAQNVVAYGRGLTLQGTTTTAQISLALFGANVVAGWAGGAFEPQHSAAFGTAATVRGSYNVAFGSGAIAGPTDWGTGEDAESTAIGAGAVAAPSVGAGHAGFCQGAIAIGRQATSATGFITGVNSQKGGNSIALGTRASAIGGGWVVIVGGSQQTNGSVNALIMNPGRVATNHGGRSYCVVLGDSLMNDYQVGLVRVGGSTWRNTGTLTVANAVSGTLSSGGNGTLTIPSGAAGIGSGLPLGLGLRGRAFGVITAPAGATISLQVAGGAGLGNITLPALTLPNALAAVPWRFDYEAVLVAVGPAGAASMAVSGRLEIEDAAIAGRGLIELHSVVNAGDSVTPDITLSLTAIWDVANVNRSISAYGVSFGMA